MHLSLVWREVGLGFDRRIGSIAGKAGRGFLEPTRSAFLTSSWGVVLADRWDCQNPKLLRLGSLQLIEMPRMTWLGEEGLMVETWELG